MLKKFLLIPLILASFAFADNSEEKQPQAEQKLIDEVLSDYRDGRYSSFLKRMDSTYKEGNKKWGYNGALEERKKLSTYVNDYKKDKKKDSFQSKMHNLVELQYRKLVEVCINNPDDKLSREVKDMVFFSPNSEEQSSLDYVNALSYKFKGDGASHLENQLINIDTEFWLKSLSLSVAKAQNKIDDTTYQKQHIVLQVEKLKKMQEACDADEFGDVKTQKHIKIASALVPKVHASSVTRKHLLALGAGKIEPQSKIEKEMQPIVAEYLEKEQSLLKEHFPDRQ